MKTAYCSDCRFSYSALECLSFSTTASCDSVQFEADATCPRTMQGCSFTRCAAQPICFRTNSDGGR